jgi:hypothetical protein
MTSWIVILLLETERDLMGYSRDIECAYGQSSAGV